jgi:hypothetical protein
MLVCAPLIDLQAQVRCGFDEQNKPGFQQRQARFENWLQKKIATRKSLQYNRSRTQAVYQIPIVVHVIHNGEPVGVGRNIPDAQILSQIQVINDDFNRNNADASQTPPEFAAVAGSIDIEFVLAKQDPDGLPTNGIVRVQGSKSGYTGNETGLFKAQSYWPAENYLNIWVVNFSDSFLGLAQFPETDLQGVDPPFDRETDGVVVDYQAFGTGGFNLLSQFDKGRTATHEIGHFLGILHIFGNEGGCSTTDYVNDTPVQNERTRGCPSHPSMSCGHNKMFQNFMDYTDDRCLNLFTEGQTARMINVLENSPRRVSLLTSPALEEPVTFSVDLEVSEIIAPFDRSCGDGIVPRVELRNRGTTKITAARVQFMLNNVAVETKDFALDLDQFEKNVVEFASIDLTEPSTNLIAFELIQINGTTDEDVANNMISRSAQIVARIIPPSTQPFNSIPSDWQIINADNGTTWTNVAAGTGNRAMFIDFYNYQADSAVDLLASPYYQLSSTAGSLLKFDKAYATFPNVYYETLRVLVGTGCSTDPSLFTEIYRKSGTALATTSEKVNPFTPTASEWSSEILSLSAYAGQTIQLRFEATNGNGNNLFLDNVQVATGSFDDVNIISLLSPGPVICKNNPAPSIEIQNLGTAPITKLNFQVSVGTQQLPVQSFTGLQLASGASQQFSLDQLNLTEGNNTVSIAVANPDVSQDATPSNNTTTFNIVYNNSIEVVPHRQKFENGLGSWSVFANPGQEKWKQTTTNFGKSYVYEAFSNSIIGQESWLVSPVMDLSDITQGSLFFSTSYGKHPSASESLRVLVSTDCGEHYNNEVFIKTGSQLQNATSGTAWEPDLATHWTREYLSINDFAGLDQVRFAFVVRNESGNNLYLDDIEFFVQDDPDPPVISERWSVYSSEFSPTEFYITFKLEEKQDVRLVLYNTIGQVVIDNTLPDVLNQTYTVSLLGQTTGVYIARIVTNTERGSVKLFVGQ